MRAYNPPSLLPRPYITLGVLGVATYWAVETSVHTWVFNDGTFFDNFFYPEPNELWMRSLTVLLGIGFSHVAQWMQDREQETRAHLNLLSHALEQAEDGVLVTDARGTIEWVNPAFTRLTGYSAAEAIGHSLAVLGAQDRSENDSASPWTQLARGETWAGAIFDRRKDGSFYPAQLSLSPVQDSHGRTSHIIGVQRDASAVVALDSRLRQARRYEEMGEVAGHVAHDFKNLLGVIQGAAELGRSHSTNDDVRKRFQTIERTTTHASAVVRQLMQLAATPSDHTTSIDLDAWLDDAWDGVLAVVPEQHTLELERPMRGLRLRGDEGQLQQVLFNLAQNAADAIGDRDGHIAVRMHARRTETGDPAGSPGMLVLQVVDDGPGIPPDKISKIFQAYFTTKGTSGGTGLGLSTVHSIVQRHGGHVCVESELGRGTVFRVELPLEAPRSGLSLPRLAGYRALVLAGDEDDDEHLQQHVSMLESLGVRGVPAFGDEELVRLAERDQADLSFIFIGVPMSRADATRLTASVHAAVPSLAVLFTRSATRDQVIPGATLIQEPFGPDELLAAIQHPSAPIPVSVTA